MHFSNSAETNYRRRLRSRNGESSSAEGQTNFSSYFVWIIVLLIALLFISIGISVVAWNELKNLKTDLEAHSLALTEKFELVADNATSLVDDRMDQLELAMTDLKKFVKAASLNKEPIQGPIGPRGEKGELGSPGEKGDRGFSGIPGLPGVDGRPGLDGLAGLPGLPSPRGPKGEIGDRGLDGLPGMKGDRGSQGQKGEPGKDSANFLLQEPNEVESGDANILKNVSFLARNLPLETTISIISAENTKLSPTTPKTPFFKKMVKAIRDG
ncbi:collagen alpha-1(I) chain isoform X1 [Folsomia candida]|uniref:collagen alpha-1(I) chain isoform X1 n=1 Tax=Folsomia candida TaxID=158441 RepID=UPI000B8FA8DE|nr:collagen alpha-1(I) chain isoform X1 [Folsomia candida]